MDYRQLLAGKMVQSGGETDSGGVSLGADIQQSRFLKDRSPRASFFALIGMFAAWSSSGAAAGPAYIQASDRDLTEKYGKALAARVFSDEFTVRRAAQLRESVAYISRADCPADPKFVLRIVQPFQLEDSNVMWIERFDVACKTTRHRSLLMLKQGDAIQVVPMAPGKTLANVVVQSEAGKIVQRAALADDPDNCKQATVVETDVSRPPTKSGSSWQERWSVHACGKTVDVVASFTPTDGGGTKIAAAKDTGSTPKETAFDTPKGAQQAASADKAPVANRGPNWEDCQWTKRLSEKPDMRIAACERVVAGGKLGIADMSTAYRWMGDALRVKAGSRDLDIMHKFELSERVLKAYDKAIELNPKDPEPYIRRATLHSKEEIEKTIADYSKAIELGTRDTQPYSARAEYYRSKGQLDRAIADFGKVIEFSPYASNYRRRGVVYLARGDHKLAIADIDAELALKPSNADKATGYLLRGIANQRSGDLRQAFADFSTSEGLVRNSIMLQYHRGIAHTEAGDYEEAVADLSKVIERASKTVGTVKDPLADKSITYRDMVVPGYTGRAYALASSGRADEGLADVQQALKLDPDNAAALKTRARILKSLGRTD